MIKKCMNCGCYSNTPLNDNFCSSKCFDEFAAELNKDVRKFWGD